MRGWRRLAAAVAVAVLWCSCSEFEPQEPYIRVLSVEPSPWHAEVDRQTGDIVFPEVVFNVGNWSKENCYLTSYEIRYYDVETYANGDLSFDNTLQLVEGDTLWVWTNAYLDPNYLVITDEQTVASRVPPGNLVRYGGTRVWVPGVGAAEYGQNYREAACAVMVADAIVRASSEYWLVENRSIAWGDLLFSPIEYPYSRDDIGIVAVVKLMGETEGGDKVETEAHIDVGTYLVLK
jgi:hypothetical protein